MYACFIYRRTPPVIYEVHYHILVKAIPTSNDALACFRKNYEPFIICAIKKKVSVAPCRRPEMQLQKSFHQRERRFNGSSGENNRTTRMAARVCNKLNFWAKKNDAREFLRLFPRTENDDALHYDRRDWFPWDSSCERICLRLVLRKVL